MLRIYIISRMGFGLFGALALRHPTKIHARLVETPLYEQHRSIEPKFPKIGVSFVLYIQSLSFMNLAPSNF